VRLKRTETKVLLFNKEFVAVCHNRLAGDSKK